MTMIERHYDDEALISLLGSNRAGSDAHLPSCVACSTKVDSFRTIAGALRDRDVWDKRELHTEAVPSTIATLRAFADRMVDEDTRAEAILVELLAGTRETWRSHLQAHPEWRNAGMVRKLIAAGERAVDTMPPDAVEITALAADIADNLEVTAYPSDTVAHLRGAAWRDHGYALYYTGNFSKAEEAVATAGHHFASCVVNEYELGRLDIVRALVLRAFERFDEAMGAASSSAEAFTRFDDTQRIVSARLAEASMLFSRGDFKRAEDLLLHAERQIAATPHADTHARVLGNLGHCMRKLGNVDEAIAYFEAAAALHTDMGVVTEAARLRWNVAATLADAGRLSDAQERMTAVLPEFERLGMSSEAAVMSLDIAELLTANERYDEVQFVCRSAMEIFKRSGTAYTSRALTALAFMREAAAHRSVTPAQVRKVREYIRRLPAEPNLLFAPPPA
jgi:tetratricopeptide (TPR) repeat protein